MHSQEPDGGRRGRRDGYSDALTPLEPLDVNACRDLDDLLRAMARTAFGARQLGHAADVLYEMVSDPRCTTVGTISGAMTVAKMGLVLAEMIDRGMLQAVVTTGAVISHGLIEATGLSHFAHRDGMDDRFLYQSGYNRVYDSLELETNFEHTRRIVFAVLDQWDPRELLSSHRLVAAIGAYLHTHLPHRGILQSAFEHHIPVYVPALTDSELGLELALFNRLRRSRGEPVVRFDPTLDVEDYATTVAGKATLGLFTIGGGVPRNWAQQIAPYLEMVHAAFGHDGQGPRFTYGVRICPEPAQWGGLSGSTYSEAVSWGKIVPTAEGGRWAEVLSDATLAWPILVKAVIQRIAKSDAGPVRSMPGLSESYAATEHGQSRSDQARRA